MYIFKPARYLRMITIPKFHRAFYWPTWRHCIQWCLKENVKKNDSDEHYFTCNTGNMKTMAHKLLYGNFYKTSSLIIY